MTRAVEDVLEEIGTGDQPRAARAQQGRRDRRRAPPRARVPPPRRRCSSPRSRGEGLDTLGERIAAEFERTLRDVELLVPFSEGGTLSELHDYAGDLEREDTEEGVRISVAAAVRRRRTLRPLRGQRQRPPGRRARLAAPRGSRLPRRADTCCPVRARQAAAWDRWTTPRPTQQDPPMTTATTGPPARRAKGPRIAAMRRLRRRSPCSRSACSPPAASPSGATAQKDDAGLHHAATATASRRAPAR